MSKNTGYELTTNNPNIKLELLNNVNGLCHYEIKWIGTKEFVHNAFAIVTLNKNFECVWKPHLAPKENMTIGDYVFNAPIMFVQNKEIELYLIPDVNYINDKRDTPYVMDYVKPESQMYFGVANYIKIPHVYHEFTNENFVVEPEEVLARFYFYERKSSNERDLRFANKLLWKLFGEDNLASFNKTDFTQKINKLSIYQEYAYEWAFDHWKSIVWNDFTMNGVPVGGCTAIVKGTQSPGEGRENNWREDQSIWNQAWFSQVRSAVGIIMSNSIKNHDKAKRIIDLALAVPVTNGLFPSVFVADENGNWENGVWKHSNRRPAALENAAHILDMSWTCWWLLKWMDVSKYRKDDIEMFVSNYSKTLLHYQNPNGSFPAWINLDSYEKEMELDNSAETAMHAMFLLKYYNSNKSEILLEAALKAIAFLNTDIIPYGRWEDFETYWSCSKEWEMKKPGVKDARSNIYNQNNFSIYWTVEAFKKAYIQTKDKQYLNSGIKVLDELSLYQAIWTPNFLKNPVLGGFGVMLSDDEWNDARQSLFAVTYYDYYKLTDNTEYLYRAYWAMKASYYMMYCPENEIVSKTYQKMFPFFHEKDYGFEMENLFHGEHTLDFYGEFSIFDWGCGSASTALEELKKRMEEK